MTPADLTAARESLGLSKEQLARALRLRGRGLRSVQRWEAPGAEVPGPVQVAVEMMVAAKGREAAWKIVDRQRPLIEAAVRLGWLNERVVTDVLSLMLETGRPAWEVVDWGPPAKPRSDAAERQHEQLMTLLGRPSG